MIVTTDCKPEGARFDMFKKVAAVGKANGSLMVAQITHPGRQLPRRLNPIAVAPSAIQMSEFPRSAIITRRLADRRPESEDKNGIKYAKPHAATQEEINVLIEGFAYAAEYLEKAGFDGIQLHAANGYLLSEFLSRTTNKRTDKYGPQTTQSRVRLISEVAQAVKARVSPSFIVAAKLNSVEFQDGGVTPQEAQELCQILEKMGVDFVELSGGTAEELGLQWTKDSTRRREAFFLEFAKAITDALGPASKLKVYLTGGFRSAEAMIKSLNAVHGVGIGRPATAEPRLCSDILEGRLYGALKPVETFENDIYGGLAIAAAQMAQISTGREPLNFGDAKVMDILKADIARWQEKTIQDGDRLEHVRPVRYSGPQLPYGVAAD